MKQPLPQPQTPYGFYYSSPIGVLKAVFKNKQLYSLSLCQNKTYNIGQKKIFKAHFSAGLELKKQLDDYFAGKTCSFKIPLAPRGTLFEKQVWKALRRIPYGAVRTYGQTALKIKNKGAARAVGRACAKNPFLLIVPCHRVTAQNSLGGFACGLHIKKTLLALEGRAHPRS